MVENLHTGLLLELEENARTCAISVPGSRQMNSILGALGWHYPA